MTIRRIQTAAIALVVIGVLAIAGILVFGPRQASIGGGSGGTDGTEASAPHPVLQPITPSTWPYSQLAVLRKQRMSNDAMPAAYFKNDEGNSAIVRSSSRYLGAVRDGSLWIAVDGRQEPCVIFTDASGGGASGCGTEMTTKSGALAMGVGSDNVEVSVFTDGAVTAKDAAGKHQIAPNVWVSGKNAPKPARASSTAPADASAFPVTEPFASYEILRRTRTSADAVPKLFGEDPSAYAKLDLSTLRYAGAYKTGKAWVAVDTTGHACLISEFSGGAVGIGCDSKRSSARGSVVTAFSTAGGIWYLVTDGKVASADLPKNALKVAPNVWAAAGN